MSHAGGPVGAARPWPVASDQQPRRPEGPRADPMAFVVLLLAGSCGMAQYLVAGWPVGRSDALGGTVVTGRQLLSELGPHLNTTASITRIALLVITVGGAALVLLGLASLLPMTHGPIGFAALLVALAIGGATVWVVAASDAGPRFAPVGAALRRRAGLVPDCRGRPARAPRGVQGARQLRREPERAFRASRAGDPAGAPARRRTPPTTPVPEWPCATGRGPSRAGLRCGPPPATPAG